MTKIAIWIFALTVYAFGVICIVDVIRKDTPYEYQKSTNQKFDEVYKILEGHTFQINKIASDLSLYYLELKKQINENITTINENTAYLERQCTLLEAKYQKLTEKKKRRFWFGR